MRKYHRWLSVFFGIFLLWIAVTGVLSQVAPMINRGSIFEEDKKEQPAGGVIPAAKAHDNAAPAALAAPAKFVCPADMNCRPKPKPGSWNVGLIHHLHSGEQFGLAGTIIALLSGVAMIFFAFSGLWLYIQMFRRRSHRESHPRRLFW